MKQFKHFLLEAPMTPQEAFTVLNIDPSKPFDLKKIYRSVSKLSHPDLGGSNEQQKQVNLAYEVLKDKKIDNGLVSGSRAWWDEVDRKHKERAEAIDKIFQTEFKEVAFLKYFKLYTKDDLIVDKKIKVGKDFATHTFKFHNEDNSTVFYLQLHASTIDIARGGGLGTGKGIDFNFYTTNYLWHANRKQKMKQRQWASKNNSLQIDPRELFPKKVLDKVFAGLKQRKFSKRDMFQGLDKVLKARNGKDYSIIPIRDKIELQMNRTTWGKGNSMWNISFLIDRANRAKSSRDEAVKGATTLLENEATFNMIVELVKKLKKVKTVDQMKKLIVKVVDKFKKTQEK